MFYVFLILMLICAALTIILLWIWMFGIQIYKNVRAQTSDSGKWQKRRKDKKLIHLRKAFFAFVIIPGLFTFASASALTVCIVQYSDKNHASDIPPIPTASAAPVVGEDDGYAFQTSSPISSEQDVHPIFRLSKVTNSTMLTLDEELIGRAAIDAEQLVTAADEQFDAYIERYCHPVLFFPFYQNLVNHFPAGEEIDYSFDKVFSLEECNAQLRGIGKRLEHRKMASSPEQIAETCHQLAIRSGDAMNFAKYQGEEDQQNHSIWLYAEISFSALINEYIYDRPKGLVLSDWYYRTAQAFDYLGGIADTDELKLKMYFISAVFLRCSYETLEEQGLQIYYNAYDCEIWDLYVEMLYRVAVRVDPAEAEGFYLEIRQVEATILGQPLPDNIIAHTTKVLNNLDLYQKWGEQYDGNL